MKRPVDEFYDALMLCVNRGFAIINPAFVFVASLILIYVSLNLSDFGWRAKRRSHTAAGLLLTGCAVAWSVMGFIYARRGGGGMTPRETDFLPYFFAMSGMLAIGSLGMQILQHLDLRRDAPREEVSGNRAG